MQLWRKWISRGFLAGAAGITTAGAFLTPGRDVAVGIGSGTMLATLLGTYLHEQTSDPWLTERRTRFLLLRECRPAIERLRRTDSSARLNIMLARKALRGHILDFHTQVGFEPDHADVDLCLKSSQGVAGRAFRAGKWAFGDLLAKQLHLGAPKTVAPNDRHDVPQYNLTDDQQTRTKPLTLVYSYPFFEMKKSSAGEPVASDRVLGVVNLDSAHPGGLTTYRARGVHAEVLSKVLPQIALVCSWLFS